MSYTQMFWDIVRDTFSKLLELHPDQAVYVGLGFMNKSLPNISADSILIEKGLIQVQLDKLNQIDPSKLPFHVRIDYYAFRDYLRLRLFFIDEWPIWKMYPNAPEILFTILVSIYLNDSISAKERISSIVRCIRDLPKFLDQSKTRLQIPIQLFLDAGILMSKNLINLIKGIYDDATSSQDTSKYITQYKEDFERACNAIESYIEWLRERRGSELRDYVMGREAFERLLKLRRIGLTSHEIVSMAEDDMSKYKKMLEDIAGEIKKDASMEDIMEMIYEDRPRNSDIAITMYRQGIIEVKRVILDKHILTLPPIDVGVSKIPSALSNTLPKVYYLMFRHEGREGGIVKFYINVSDDVESLKIHNAHHALHRILQYLYPGYHVIYTYSLLSKNYVRMMLDIPEILDGWSKYADYIMGEYGFLNSPKDRFLRYLDLYHSAILAYLDVKVNTGEMDHVSALNYLMDHGYMSKSEALMEILKIVAAPSTALAPYVGFKKILSMRRRMKNLLGRYYNDKWFHNSILKNAILPLAYLESAILYDAAEYMLESRASI